MTKHSMYFINPEMHLGLNSTVRLGDKWMKVEYGDELQFSSSDNMDIIICIGRVVGKSLIPFRRIPKEWLDIEHDISCRSLEGLYTAMKRAYQDQFTWDSLITVIIFLQEDLFL